MFQNLLALLLAGTLSMGPSGTSLKTNVHVFHDNSLLSVSALPYKNPELLAPGSTSAKAAIAIDLKSQSLLFEKNPDLVLPIASLTKLMTAYIILEENDPDAIVTVSQKAANIEGSRMGLVTGEQISVKNLLYGLLINSGNDAAVALAEFNAGTEDNFVKKMNDEAELLGLDETKYANSTGLDYGQGHSSPRDLALLGSYLLKKNTIREIVKLSTADVSGTTGQNHHLANTNILLGELGIQGMKTGKTPAAGECLIAFAITPNGNEVLSVVIGSENRFADTKVLIDWIYRAYTW